MRYTHVMPHLSYIGLPKGEIESTQLSQEQLLLLSAAVAAGIYAPLEQAEIVPVEVKAEEISKPIKKAGKKPVWREDDDNGNIDQA